MAEPLIVHYHHRYSQYDQFQHNLGRPTDCRCEPECYPQTYEGGLIWVVVQHQAIDLSYPRGIIHGII